MVDFRQSYTRYLNLSSSSSSTIILLTGYNVHWLLKYYSDNNYDHNKPTTVKQQYGHGHRDAILPIANSHLPRVEDATFHQVSVECE